MNRACKVYGVSMRADKKLPAAVNVFNLSTYAVNFDNEGHKVHVKIATYDKSVEATQILGRGNARINSLTLAMIPGAPPAANSLRTPS